MAEAQTISVRARVQAHAPSDDARYLAIAYARALDSIDPSTQNGCVIISAKGTASQDYIGSCNVMPSGIEPTPIRLQERDCKLRYMEHAERGAIYEAAASGISTEGATMYCPWAPCLECARAIIMSGISRLVVHKQRMAITHKRWLYDVTLAVSMLSESESVIVEEYDGPIDAEPILVSGKQWSPRTLRYVGDEEEEMVTGISHGKKSSEVVQLGRALLKFKEQYQGDDYQKDFHAATIDIGFMLGIRAMRAARMVGDIDDATLDFIDSDALLHLTKIQTPGSAITAAFELARVGTHVTLEIAKEVADGCHQATLWYRMLPENRHHCTRIEICKAIQRMPSKDFAKFKAMAYQIRKKRSVGCDPMPIKKGAEIRYGQDASDRSEAIKAGAVVAAQGAEDIGQGEGASGDGDGREHVPDGD